MEDRIKLAEAIGGPIWEAYIDPGKHPECVDLPDPFTDANDCEALIRFLNDSGLELCIVHGIGYVRVLLSGGKDRDKTFKPISVGEYGDEYNDWKQGVCELALKVLK